MTVTTTTAVDRLVLRQKAYDLKTKENKSTSEIQSELGLSRSTLWEWFNRPRPSDEEVRVAKLCGVINRSTTQPSSFKVIFDEELLNDLREQAEIQGTTVNRLLHCAAQLYVDCLKRSQGDSTEPVNLLGYRAKNG